MKEIKFRAWDKKTFRLCYFDLFHIWGGLCKSFNNPCIDIIAIDVEQYTGLKDKNGREIYEGDVIKIDESNYPVVFCDGCFMLDGYDNGDYYQGTDPLCTCWSESEIIGNIHENSDLLGKSNE